MGKLKRDAATAGTPTADTVCDACTNVGDTRVSACAACDTTVKTVGGANTDDTCTETCANGFYSATGMCKAHTVCDVARGTKSAGTPTTDAVCKPCAGKFGENSATCAAQTACTAVVGAVADATYTCTSATDSLFLPVQLQLQSKLLALLVLRIPVLPHLLLLLPHLLLLLPLLLLLHLLEEELLLATPPQLDLHLLSWLFLLLLDFKSTTTKNILCFFPIKFFLAKEIQII